MANRVRPSVHSHADCHPCPPSCSTLHGNKLTGTLPATWGDSESFRVLKLLTLAGNPLGGNLPPEWGANASSLPKLENLNISNANLTGTLPAGWGAGLQDLAVL